MFHFVSTLNMVWLIHNALYANGFQVYCSRMFLSFLHWLTTKIEFRRKTLLMMRMHFSFIQSIFTFGIILRTSHCCRRCICGDEDPSHPSLIDPDLPILVRDGWRCGMTNLGGGCGVTCGIVFADICRVRAGRFSCPALLFKQKKHLYLRLQASNGIAQRTYLVLATWIELDRPGKLFRGGMTGGGPRLGTKTCDWTRGGSSGRLAFVSSVIDGRDCTLGSCCCWTGVVDLLVLVFGWIAANVTVGFGDGRTTFCGTVWFGRDCDGELWVESTEVVSVTGRFWCFCGWITFDSRCICCDCCWGNAFGILNFFLCSWPAATYEKTHSTE